MEVKRPVIDESWYRVLRPQFESAYFADLKAFLVNEKRQYAVYPPGPLIFNAFNLTPFDKVKVVILGARWRTLSSQSAEYLQGAEQRPRHSHGTLR